MHLLCNKRHIKMTLRDAELSETLALRLGQSFCHYLLHFSAIYRLMRVMLGAGPVDIGSLLLSGLDSAAASDLPAPNIDGNVTDRPLLKLHKPRPEAAQLIARHSSRSSTPYSQALALIPALRVPTSPPSPPTVRESDHKVQIELTRRWNCRKSVTWCKLFSISTGTPYSVDNTACLIVGAKNGTQFKDDRHHTTKKTSRRPVHTID